MCGRYTVPFEGKDLIKRYNLTTKLNSYTPTFNASPGQILPVVTKNSPKKVVQMKWGFIAPWEKDFTKAKFKPINARSDKLTNGFYRQSFNETRCLIPVGGYYEWKKYQMDGKVVKQPYYFRLKNEDIFSLGGFYSVHKDIGGLDHYFYTIITCEPNSLQKPIHDRMPLIISRNDEEEWLDTKKPLEMLKSYPSKLMEVWRVPTLVSSFKNDGPRLIEKIPES